MHEEMFVHDRRPVYPHVVVYLCVCWILRRCIDFLSHLVSHYLLLSDVSSSPFTGTDGCMLFNKKKALYQSFFNDALMKARRRDVFSERRYFHSSVSFLQSVDHRRAKQPRRRQSEEVHLLCILNILYVCESGRWNVSKHVNTDVICQHCWSTSFVRQSVLEWIGFTAGGWSLRFVYSDGHEEWVAYRLWI